MTEHGTKTETTTTYRVCRRCDTVLNPKQDKRYPECGGEDYYLWHREGPDIFAEDE